MLRSWIDRRLPDGPRNICIIKPSALGDIVQAMPVIPTLREAFPNARISWVIKRELRDLLTGHPDLFEVIECPAAKLSAWLKFFSELRSRKFDLVLDLQGLFRTALMTVATGARLKAGLQTAREGSRFSVHYLLQNTSRAVPATVRYHRIAEELGRDDVPETAHIPIPPEVEDAVSRCLSSDGRMLVTIHAGAQWVTKRWPPEKFAEIALRVVNEWNARIVLVGVGSELPLTQVIERAILQQRSSADVINLAGKTTLKELAGVLGRSDYVISNDSGPMHLGAAMGRPTLGIFTCTSPLRSGPPGSRNVLVSTSLPCAAGYHKICPMAGLSHHACFEETSVDRVWRGLVQLRRRTEAEDQTKAA